MVPVFQPTFQLLQDGRAMGAHSALQERSGTRLPLAGAVPGERSGSSPRVTALLGDTAVRAWVAFSAPWAAWLHPGAEHPQPSGVKRAGMRQRWGASILLTLPAPAGSLASRDALPWHSPARQVRRAPPELVLLPARESLTFIKAKFTLTF